jgi:type V secretory pathway adhesin AidA
MHSSAANKVVPHITGPNSSRSIQTPFSTEPTKEDTIVTAADQTEDMQTITQQQAITPAPDTAKPPFPGAQDASRKFQESIPDDGPVENYSPKPAQTQPPAATLDVSPDASSKAKSTGQGAKPPTGYQASSPETQLGSSQTQAEAAPAEQKFAVTGNVLVRFLLVY